MFAEYEQQSSGSTSVIEKTEEQLQKNDGGSNRFAHYVSKQFDYEMTPGATVVALCGKVWRPTRDPKGYPVCPICKKIYKEMTSSEGFNNSNWPFK